jgi:hypothetical protein
MKPGPDFIIIGGMKCMTSTLHTQLAAQPGICMSEPKEPCYFSDDEVYSQGPEWYRRLWANRNEGDLCGESSTHYTKLPTHPNTVARMAELLPEAKLIYVMRHPIDRLLSQYRHEWTMGNVGDQSADQAVSSMPSMIDYGLYAYQLKPYLRAFGNQQILPVFFERLAQEPQVTLNRVCKFLGYRGEARWSSAIAKQNAGGERMRRCAWRDRLVDAPVLSGLRRTLIPRVIRERVKRIWQMSEAPTLGADLAAELKSTFDDDLRQLSDWLTIDAPLTCDNFHRVAACDDYDWLDSAIASESAGHAEPIGR